MGWRSGQSYSQDLRDRVIGAVDGGMAVRQAAVTFGVSIAYIYKALIRRRLTGDSGPNPNRGHRAARRAQIFYLPPYSPDMNPIELAFSKLKALLRQQPARTVDALVERIGHILDRFLPAECANFFHAAGYQRSI